MKLYNEKIFFWFSLSNVDKKFLNKTSVLLKTGIPALLLMYGPVNKTIFLNYLFFNPSKNFYFVKTCYLFILFYNNIYYKT